MKFDTEKFIIEIQNRPPLWNKKCSDYSDKNIKQRKWEEVVNILYGAELSSDETKKLCVNLQKKWRNVRDCFVKAHKAKDTKNGKKRKCPYVFYNSLLFLKDVVSVDSKTSNITSNVEINNEHEIVGQHTVARPSDSSWAPTHNKNNKNNEDDEDCLFFMSLVKDFKKIPEHLHVQTKFDVLKVIQDAQMSNHPNTWADCNTQNNLYSEHNNLVQKIHYSYNHTPMQIANIYTCNLPISGNCRK